MDIRSCPHCGGRMLTDDVRPTTEMRLAIGFRLKVHALRRVRHCRDCAHHHRARSYEILQEDLLALLAPVREDDPQLTEWVVALGDYLRAAMVDDLNNDQLRRVHRAAKTFILHSGHREFENLAQAVAAVDMD